VNKTPELIESLLAEIQNAPSGELPSIRGELARLEAVLMMRLTTPQQFTDVPHDDDAGDRLIDVKAAAEKIGMSVRFMYKHASEYGGEKHGGALRFSAKRLERIIKRRGYS
jgi:hypothetical protein